MERLLLFLLSIAYVTALCVGDPAHAQNPTFRAQNTTVAVVASFPFNGIIDNFDRANEGPPLSASWTDTIVVGEGGFKVNFDVAQGDTGGFNSTYRNTAVYGPDVEAYLTLPASSQADVYLRIVAEGTAGVDGYSIDANETTDLFRVFRIDDGVYTQLGADISTTIGIGDSFGATIIGTTITVYHCGLGMGCGVSEAGWTVIDTRTDATYSAAGRIGIGVSGSGIVDDFGGGSR